MNKYTDVENFVVVLCILGPCSHHRHLSICPTVAPRVYSSVESNQCQSACSQEVTVSSE